MVILIKKMKLLLFTLGIGTIIVVLIFISRLFVDGTNTNTLMGGQIREHAFNKGFTDIETTVFRSSPKVDEKYFRPSNLPILNDRRIDSEFLYEFLGKKPEEIRIPEELLKTPDDTIANYFSIIKHGENLVDGKNGGCGSVGDSDLPYHITYNFFTKKYKEKMNVDSYVKSFEGIGHTNLIKMHKIPAESQRHNYIRYFVEIETIEGSNTGATYFAYYYGFIYLTVEQNLYKIAQIDFFGEDFLCAPYHGWYHLAEANVDIRYGEWCGLIKERYPTKQNGYVKNMYFRGTDNNDYLIVFFELTNGTDIEIAQYRKDILGKWKLIRLNPEKCVEQKKN